MAAADNQTLYVLRANGQVRRGNYTTGWIWEKNTDSGLDTGHTIIVLNDNVLVGAAANELSPAAYSPDGGQSWTKIATKTATAGNRHVAFDTYFDENKIIYVADDSGGIYRWAIGRSDSWDDLSPPNHSYYGIGLGGRGVIYGAYNPSTSGADRALYPRSGIPKPGIFWDSLTTGLTASVKFSTEPGSLAISRASLWSIDAHDYNPTNNQGCLWAFTDTLAQTEPMLIEPEDGMAIGCDPVSGRNQQVDLMWEQLSLADTYEVQIGKDVDFSLRITEAEPLTNPFYQPPQVTSPAYIIMPGILPEANATYYWQLRVRQAATGQVIRSQWSETHSFSIKAGLPVRSPYLGAQALGPRHNARGIPVSPVAFSWTPFKESTDYRFVLARDTALSDILIETIVPTTAYQYKGKLDNGTSYFWQVTATNPLPSEPSPVFSFTTEARPAPPPPAPPPSYQILNWLMAIFLSNILGDVMILATIVLLFRSRRI